MNPLLDATNVGNKVLSIRKAADEQRHHKKDRENGGDHAADHHASERLLRLSADARGNGCRQKSQAGRHAGHNDRAHLIETAFFKSGIKTFLTLSATNA